MSFYAFVESTINDSCHKRVKEDEDDDEKSLTEFPCARNDICAFKTSVAPLKFDFAGYFSLLCGAHTHITLCRKVYRQTNEFIRLCDIEFQIIYNATKGNLLKLNFSSRQCWRGKCD